MGVWGCVGLVDTGIRIGLEVCPGIPIFPSKRVCSISLSLWLKIANRSLGSLGHCVGRCTILYRLERGGVVLWGVWMGVIVLWVRGQGMYGLVGFGEQSKGGKDNMIRDLSQI